MDKHVQDTWEDHLTVRELKAMLSDLPDETPVYYQRIEDVYFEKYAITRKRTIL